MDNPTNLIELPLQTFNILPFPPEVTAKIEISDGKITITFTKPTNHTAGGFLVAGQECDTAIFEIPITDINETARFVLGVYSSSGTSDSCVFEVLGINTQTPTIKLLTQGSLES